jgi:hypothetical protein
MQLAKKFFQPGCIQRSRLESMAGMEPNRAQGLPEMEMAV